MSAELVIASIAVFLFGTGAVVFGIKLLAGRNRRPVARAVFTCPACEAHAFGSSALSDGTHTRHCTGVLWDGRTRVPCTFRWHESQDCMHMGEIGARLAVGDPMALFDGGGYDLCANCKTSRAMHGADGRRSRCPDGWKEPGRDALELGARTNADGSGDRDQRDTLEHGPASEAPELEQRPRTNADAGGDVDQRDTHADHAKLEPAPTVLLEQFEVAAETFCHQCDRPLVPRSLAFVLGGGVFLCSRQCTLHKLPSGYELREERDTVEDPPGPDELEQRNTLESAGAILDQRDMVADDDPYESRTWSRGERVWVLPWGHRQFRDAVKLGKGWVIDGGDGWARVRLDDGREVDPPEWALGGPWDPGDLVGDPVTPEGFAKERECALSGHVPRAGGGGFVPGSPEAWHELERLVDDAETCVTLRGGSVEGACAPLARRIRSLIWPRLGGAQ
ncbi:hypothetical protein [Polyangium mundeleinium]|uniref:Uncharacterized protein n=1 Tax=Polyangium mundeleinium TaxID=2995306 RepID=A0ABT5EXW8_9BACT|nr:hypothetical protein [Polyangium mundeleinium]MDC0746672.1 hypothetical protein [Polyangium mundeleinium]